MPPKPLIERARRGPFDEIWTPAHALTSLLPYLDKRKMIWECAPGSGKLVEALRAAGHRVDFRTPPDFMHEQPLGSVIVTNPPYSKKVQFLRRANELAMPFAFLLPITTLGSRKCQRELENATNVQIILLAKRIDFTGKGRPWFAVAWFVSGLGISYGSYEDRVTPQLIFPEDK